MDFAESARKESEYTRTENGAVALNTTSDARLDFFGTVGALRGADEVRITRLFSEAYLADPLFATKTVFYARDIRGGLGERQTFRTLLQFMAKYHPEALRPNLDLIGVYGRYDDMYCLIGTPMENEMWAAMKKQFEEDLRNLQEGNAISLLAKWIKTADASSAKTRKLGILTARKLGYTVYTFKRLVRAMRKRIGIVEALMSAGRWDEIHYPAVPSRAMMVYRKAFMRHDEDRYNAFVQKAVRGEETIHAGVLFPYDIVEKVFAVNWNSIQIREDETLEAQWRQLPDYIEAGPYHNMFMSFSGTSRIQVLKGETLAQKIRSIDMDDWQSNTNLQAAFKHVLKIAVENHVAQEAMPKSLIVISDMEIDYCGDRNWTFYEKMSQEYREHGYQIPNIIIWNAASRHDIFHADKSRTGVQLVSGQSASVFRQVMQCVGMNPVEAMEKIINSDRYAAITIA